MAEYSDDELDLEDIPELTDEQLNRMQKLTPLQKTLTQIIIATLKYNKVSDIEAAKMMLLDKVEYVTMIRTFDVAWIPEIRLVTLLTMLLRYKKIKLPPKADKQLEKIAKQIAA